MKMILIVTPILMFGLSSCATFRRSPLSKEEITAYTRKLVDQREKWRGIEYIHPELDSDTKIWRVQVQEKGHIEGLPCGCGAYEPGIPRRELFVTETGKLISYEPM